MNADGGDITKTSDYNANEKIMNKAKRKEKPNKMKDIFCKTEEISAIIDYTNVITIGQGRTIDNIMCRMNEDLQTHKKMVNNLHVGLKKAKNKRYYKIVCILIGLVVFFIVAKFTYNIVF